ncbi:MAG TPA: DoxX family protein [Ferruginibacter sp.]|nr:DoxX family protein [Ferruginibacter sp.]HMP21182.1 DoxX family protein [Ferruginibacter sp.]
MNENLPGNKPQNKIDTALLLLRLGMGLLMTYHGADKIVHFDNEENGSMNFLGIGTTISQILVILVELVGGLMVVAGFYTRLGAAMITGWIMYVLAKAFKFDITGHGEKSFLFVIGFLTIAIAGAGRYSLEKIIKNKQPTK